MALPYDAPGHRPAPEVKQQADATRVNLTQVKAANFLKLIQALKQTRLSEHFTQDTGLQPAFLDSLGALVGAMPKQMTTQTANRGEFWPYGPRRGEIAMTEKDWPEQFFQRSYKGHGTFTDARSGSRYTPGQMRAVTAHEFGHMLDYTTPGLFEDFESRNPNVPKKATYGGQVNVNREAFADAFATAVRKVFPEIGDQRNAYAYASSPYLTNPRQQALLDSLVRARLNLVGSPSAR